MHETYDSEIFPVEVESVNNAVDENIELLHSIINGAGGNKADSVEKVENASSLKDIVESHIKQNEYEKLLEEIALAEAALAEEEKGYAFEQSQYKAQAELLPVLANVYEDELNEINNSLTSAHATLQDELLGILVIALCYVVHAYCCLFLLGSRFMLEARQLKLISELQSIYPIEQLDINGDYAIRGNINHNV